jgi:hypothetical protein
LFGSKEIISGNTSVLIYQVPVSAINKNSIVANITGCEILLEVFIFMVKSPILIWLLEDTRPTFVVNLDGAYVWDKRDMGVTGWFYVRTFINYAIIDENNRVLVLEGFAIHLKKEKRDLMLELEAIIRSVAVIKEH